MVKSLLTGDTRTLEPGLTDRNHSYITCFRTKPLLHRFSSIRKPSLDFNIGLDIRAFTGLEAAIGHLVLAANLYS